MDKKLLRKEILSLRNQLSKEQLKKADREASTLLMNYPGIFDTPILYLYASYGSEVPTSSLLEVCLKKRIRTAYPRVLDPENMEFYEVTKKDQLIPGYKGILEPDASCQQVTAPGLMIVPGIVFDEQNNRIGYGGGYYDRYLKRRQKQDLITVGICFPFQKIKVIPAESFDIRLDAVLCVPILP